MKTELINLCFIIASCFIIYFIYKNLKITASYKEGMTDASGNEVSSTNGIAGNAASYGAAIKSATIQLQDTFLISKYRSDYETVILNLDDLINNLMLKASLTIDPKQPAATIMELSKLGQAKVALNSVMKFIDSQ
jgi:hypothetical protein